MDGQHPSSLVLNLDRVLPYMQYRKSVRYFNGLYTASNPHRLGLMLLVILFLWTFKAGFLVHTGGSYDFGVVLSLSYTLPSGAQASEARVVAGNVITYFLLLCLLLLAATQLTGYDYVLQLLCFLALAFFIVSLSTRRASGLHPSSDGNATEGDPTGTADRDYQITQDLVMQVFIFSTLLHMALGAISRRVFPLMARHNFILVRCAVGKRQDLADPTAVASLIELPPGYSPGPERRLVACHFNYVAPWYVSHIPWLGSEDTITYVGEIDDAGNPSGYGEWRDTHWHGEHLTGFWHDGRPTGPFRSRETGSASGFMNLRIAYFRNRGEALQKAACVPRLTPLQFGLVACEVSTSGAWFKSLPRLRELLKPVEIHDELMELAAPEAPDDWRRSRTRSSNGLRASLARPSVAGPWQMEALLFVHGLGVDMHKALRHYAQMMALSCFPPHISPVMFSWPSSVPLAYFWARYRAAEAPETGLALAAAVRALAADGFRGLHIVVHSMGTRVLGNALPHLEALLGEGGAAPSSGMRLRSITICNPDYGLKRFTEDFGPRLRALCPLVTLYGDTADGALALSETVNALARPFLSARRVALAVPTVARTAAAAMRDAAEGVRDAALLPLNTAPSGVEALHQAADGPGAGSRLDLGGGANSFANQRSAGLAWWAERVLNYRRRVRKPFLYDWLEHSLGRRIYQVVDPVTGRPLDIDVVDLSYLSSNVNDVRHTHFALNREILDDLWEIIVLGRRAAQRSSRLQHVTGNVYSMAVAPYFLSTKQI
ncbi:hypothetical protein GPECTOR_2g1308 [Gonium pectorale]|uniref:Uncharacterized protein n=1 Tax=Gonium pectorale TaxID=33097 RepID=A0A150H1L2_GONPE|nr:hypothetical protein GPECTOR_2g1308 [Gonium pectorale]|eukprot:KXZ55758.1 hypothetical protein GPECTOR_2g1308 [Gonium pectorale]